MTQIEIILERSKDFWWAYSTNVEGINGGGETEEAARREVLQCIELQKELGNLSAHETYKPVFNYAAVELCAY